MSVEVKRKKGESFDALIRRFQRRFQQSGRALQKKKIRFHEGDLNQTKKRAKALRREEKKTQYEYEFKTGKLKQDDRKKKGRK